MNGRRAAAFMAALAAVQPAHGQAVPADAATPIVSVVIVARASQAGAGIERDALPYAVQLADSRAIARAQSDSLADFMARNLNGVNLNDISGNPFQGDLLFRGQRASPVLGSAQGISVYLDGVRVNEPFGDVVNWDMLPEAAIDTVMLVPGSNPLYGLNTLGGAVALTTKSGLQHPGTDAALSSTDAGRRRLELAYGVVTEERWHAFVAATVVDDAGWRAQSASRLANMLLKFGRSDGDTTWHASVLGGASRLRGNGLLPDAMADADRRAAYTYPDETRNRLLQGSVQLNHHFGAQASLAATAYARSSRRDTVNGDLSDDYVDYARECASGFAADGSAHDAACGMTAAGGTALHPAALNSTSTRQHSQGTSAQLSFSLRRHRLDAGLTFDRSSVAFAQFEQAAHLTPQRAVQADASEDRLASSSVIGTSRAVGVFVADSWALAPATHLSASVRYGHAQVRNVLTNDGLAQPRESFGYGKLNPSLGVSHATGSGLTLFANLAQGNRVPTVIELGCADPAQPCRLPVGLQSDPYLRQVVARTAEAGGRWQQGDASVSASFYRTVNHDDILFMSAGTSQHGYFANFDRTLRQGVDASASWRVRGLTAQLGYSLLDARYAAAGHLFTGVRDVLVAPGSRIAGLPRHTFKLNLDWKAGARLNVGADLLAVSDMVSQGNEDGLRADPVAGEPARTADWRIRGHALLNLRASYRPAAQWEWFARVTNVFDRHYQSFGAVALDMFPGGQLAQAHRAPAEVAPARFVAPGAPRSVAAGLRYRF